MYHIAESFHGSNFLKIFVHVLAKVACVICETQANE